MTLPAVTVGDRAAHGWNPPAYAALLGIPYSGAVKLAPSELAKRLGFGDAVPLFAQMHHFDLIPGGIERNSELLLGGNADRASRVIEDGLAHWRLLG